MSSMGEGQNNATGLCSPAGWARSMLELRHQLNKLHHTHILFTESHPNRRYQDKPLHSQTKTEASCMLGIRQTLTALLAQPLQQMPLSVESSRGLSFQICNRIKTQCKAGREGGHLLQDSKCLPDLSVCVRAGTLPVAGGQECQGIYQT